MCRGLRKQAVGEIPREMPPELMFQDSEAGDSELGGFADPANSKPERRGSTDAKAHSRQSTARVRGAEPQGAAAPTAQVLEVRDLRQQYIDSGGQDPQVIMCCV